MQCLGQDLGQNSERHITQIKGSRELYHHAPQSDRQVCPFDSSIAAHSHCAEMLQEVGALDERQALQNRKIRWKVGCYEGWQFIIPFTRLLFDSNFVNIWRVAMVG